MKSTHDFPARYGSGGQYRDLVRDPVRHVLFVSSLYESFILAEDGHFHERVLGRFVEVTFREPPDLTRVSSGREALRHLRRDRPPVDLMITSPHVGDMDAVDLAREVAASKPNVPVAVLGYDEQELHEFLQGRGMEGLEAVFLHQGDARLMLSIVQAVEDRRNVEWDTGAGVPVFLVIEDNIRVYSSFLPVIYAEILNLSHAVSAEAGNRLQRIMRMRARPKVLLATSFERAQRDFERHRGTMMGIVSDMEFPRDGALSRSSGRDFVELVRSLEPEMPIALQSSNPDTRAIADELGTGFLLKGSPDFLAQLRSYLSERLFFGDFVFRDADGEEIDRARNLKGMVQRLRTVPAESVAYHAQRHDFSRWLRARAELDLASKLRPRTLDDYMSVEQLRSNLVGDIDRYRRERSRGSVTPFRPGSFDGEEGMVQIGGGSLGGKGRGLAFASRLLDDFRVQGRYPTVDIVVPPAVVLGTAVFDQFLDDNDLRVFALQSEGQAETVERVVASPLPEETRQALREVLGVMTGPLAVRSSSLLEDSPEQPFAGIYETILLANDAAEPDERLGELEEAIKRVYASTFSDRARRFLSATTYRLELEAMAVIIQELVGSRHGDRFYPHISGVARSHNFYPMPPSEPEDGIAAVALGLGKTVTEGEPCLRFVPAHPAHLFEHSTAEGMREYSQRDFWALRLGAPRPTEDSPVVSFPLKAAEEDGTLAPVASTYSAENDAVYDGIGRAGTRLVSFAPILKHHIFPLADIVRDLLGLGITGTRQGVEIEFAATLPTKPGEKARVGFLQLRPLAMRREEGDVDIKGFDKEQLFCESPSVLGHGRLDSLRDWVVVDQSRFDRSNSAGCAEAVAHFNGRLRREGRPYGLIGVGRWGSTHPWLGIPVKWEDISGARVIVEAGFRDARVTPSQGTHFYQNLASLHVGYFTVNAFAGEGYVDWEWLAEQPAVEEKGYVRLVRFEKPAVAVMNGRDRAGVLLKPE